MRVWRGQKLSKPLHKTLKPEDHIPTTAGVWETAGSLLAGGGWNAACSRMEKVMTLAVDKVRRSRVGEALIALELGGGGAGGAGGWGDRLKKVFDMSRSLAVNP